MPPALPDRLRSSSAVTGLVLVQLVATVVYAAFLLMPGRSESDTLLSLEYYSFYVAPFLWAALFVAGLWLVRQPLSAGQVVAVKVGLLLTGLCVAAAIAFAGIFVFADFIFWLTDF